MVERAFRIDPSPRPPPPGGSNDYDDDTVRLRLLSPAFDARPPEIRNPDLIPVAPRHAMGQSWDRHFFSERPVRIRVFEEAFVVREGLVFDRNLAVVQSTKLHLSDTDVAAARREIEAARGAGCIRRIRGIGLLCKSPPVSNYGHYLVDMFPKAWLGDKIFGRPGLSFIVHQSDMMMVVAESLIQIGIKPTDIVWTGHDPVVCERLLTIDGLTFHGQYQSPLCDCALSELASSVTAGKHEKLFIPRRSRTRPLINEEAVKAVLERNGFQVIEPGAMSPKEQIAAFKGAKTVVGCLGAALTNIAFCPKGSKIVALTSASFPDTFFWFQSQHRRHEYLEIRCKDVREFDLNQETWNFGFQIDEADVQYLASL
jgi:capsular polysaccharide biosynthesis protein